MSAAWMSSQIQVLILPSLCAVSYPSGDDYQILRGLGEGAYGTVAAAIHKPSGREVAIKKVLPFEHTLFCLRTLRELKLLKFFSDSSANENVSIGLSIFVELTLMHRGQDYCHLGHRQATINRDRKSVV